MGVGMGVIKQMEAEGSGQPGRGCVCLHCVLPVFTDLWPSGGAACLSVLALQGRLLGPVQSTLRSQAVRVRHSSRELDRMLGVRLPLCRVAFAVREVLSSEW